MPDYWSNFSAVLCRCFLDENFRLSQSLLLCFIFIRSIEIDEILKKILRSRIGLRPSAVLDMATPSRKSDTLCTKNQKSQEQKSRNTQAKSQSFQYNFTQKFNKKIHGTFDYGDRDLKNVSENQINLRKSTKTPRQTSKTLKYPTPKNSYPQKH